MFFDLCRFALFLSHGSEVSPIMRGHIFQVIYIVGLIVVFSFKQWLFGFDSTSFNFLLILTFFNF